MNRPPVKLAVMPLAVGPVLADPDWMAGFAVGIEALGYESIVTFEHAVLIGGATSRYPYSSSGAMPLAEDAVIPDPVATLAYVAGATRRLGLATGLLVLPLHSPVVLAKRLATVDRLSGGRLRVGVGLGWLHEELAACGVDPGGRGFAADAALATMRALWAEDGAPVATAVGPVVAHSHPKPVRPGGIPLHVGGNSPAARRRAARYGDGWQPLGLDADALADGLRRLHQEAAAAGREPAGLEITVGAPPPPRITASTLEDAAARGVDRLLVTSADADLDAALDGLAAVAARVGLPAG